MFTRNTEAPCLESFHSTHLFIHFFDKWESENQHQSTCFLTLSFYFFSTVILLVTKQSAGFQFSSIYSFHKYLQRPYYASGRSEVAGRGWPLKLTTGHCDPRIQELCYQKGSCMGGVPDSEHEAGRKASRRKWEPRWGQQDKWLGATETRKVTQPMDWHTISDEPKWYHHYNFTIPTPTHQPM